VVLGFWDHTPLWIELPSSFFFLSAARVSRFSVEEEALGPSCFIPSVLTYNPGLR
jgi:hypothetical protein